MRVCKRCGTAVEKETEIEGYPYYCPDCDENMYEFETEERKMVKFRTLNCKVSVERYGNGNTALQLWDEEGPVATATVNFDEKLPKDQAYIKDYSENEGMLQALKDAGIVTEVLSVARVGFVVAPLCKLNLEWEV